MRHGVSVLWHGVLLLWPIKGKSEARKKKGRNTWAAESQKQNWEHAIIKDGT